MVSHFLISIEVWIGLLKYQRYCGKSEGQGEKLSHKEGLKGAWPSRFYSQGFSKEIPQEVFKLSLRRSVCLHTVPRAQFFHPPKDFPQLFKLSRCNPKGQPTKQVSKMFTFVDHPSVYGAKQGCLAGCSRRPFPMQLHQ